MSISKKSIFILSDENGDLFLIIAIDCIPAFMSFLFRVIKIANRLIKMPVPIKIHSIFKTLASGLNQCRHRSGVCCQSDMPQHAY